MNLLARDLTFSPNADYPRHRWYRLTEGFSPEFVRKCIDNSGIGPNSTVLDPFCGSGTTVLTSAALQMNSIGIELNPQLAMVARAKSSRIGYDLLVREFGTILKQRPLSSHELEKQTPGYATLRKGNRFRRWLYGDQVLRVLLPMATYARSASSPIRELLLLTLARAAADLSNAKKDGKALRYNTGWRNSEHSEDDAREAIERSAMMILEDICSVPLDDAGRSTVINASCLDALNSIPKDSVECVVTSPPYLNSRDYTDLLNGEMWLLGFVSDYAAVRQLRRQAIRSHMQVQFERTPIIRVPSAAIVIHQLQSSSRKDWARGLPEMVQGYFDDLWRVLRQLWRIMKSGATGYINVAESAYGGIVIPTLAILMDSAASLGFASEVRDVRGIRRSPQQFHSVADLREGVVVFSKEY